MSISEDSKFSTRLFQLICKGDNEAVELYQEWQTILQRQGISWQIRQNCDPWFKECFLLGTKELPKIRANGVAEMAKKREQECYTNLLDSITDTIQKQTDGNIKNDLQIGFKQIEAKFGDDPHSLVTKVITMRTEEENLVKKYFQESMDVTDESHETEQIIRSLQDKEAKICEELKKLEKLCNDLKEMLEEKCVTSRFKKNGVKQLVTNLESQKNSKDLTEDENKYLNKMKGEILPRCEGVMKKCENRAKEYGRRVSSDMKATKKEFEKLRDDYNSLVAWLLREVEDWRKHQQRVYGLQAKYDCQNLESIAERCAECGEQLFSVTSSINRWHNLIASVTEEVSGSCRHACYQLRDQFLDLHLKLIQGTFLVVDQSDCIVKTKEKKFPKIRVRVLAADRLKLLEPGEVVTAYFCNEDDLKTEPESSASGFLSSIRTSSQKLTEGNTQHFMKSCSFRDAYYEATFKNIKLSNFKRAETEKAVHEEKYRLVFTTVVKISGREETIWAVSLPIVVTTGTNQNCAGLASILWQCFGTDVFDVPFKHIHCVSKEPLKLTEVIEMLKQKMTMLGRKELTTEHIHHLSQRLMGEKWASRESNVQDVEIPFNLFCLEKMDNCDFSFWTWICSIYNLIDKYLKEFWLAGLIEGFVSKEAAAEKLLSCPNKMNRLFLLRFSDRNIKKSQGMGSMFGGLSVSFLTIRQDNTGKRNLKISAIKITSDHLAKKNLANILKVAIGDDTLELVCEYLYPDAIPRDSVFGKYYEKGKVSSGYAGVEDALIVHLEQHLCDLNISDTEDVHEFKHKQPSILAKDVSSAKDADRPKKRAKRRQNQDKTSQSKVDMKEQSKQTTAILVSSLVPGSLNKDQFQIPYVVRDLADTSVFDSAGLNPDQQIDHIASETADENFPGLRMQDVEQPPNGFLSQESSVNGQQPLPNTSNNGDSVEFVNVLHSENEVLFVSEVEQMTDHNTTLLQTPHVVSEGQANSEIMVSDPFLSPNDPNQVDNSYFQENETGFLFDVNTCLPQASQTTQHDVQESEEFDQDLVNGWNLEGSESPSSTKTSRPEVKDVDLLETTVDESGNIILNFNLKGETYAFRIPADSFQGIQDKIETESTQRSPNPHSHQAPSSTPNGEDDMTSATNMGGIGSVSGDSEVDLPLDPDVAENPEPFVDTAFFFNEKWTPVGN